MFCFLDTSCPKHNLWKFKISFLLLWKKTTESAQVRNHSLPVIWKTFCLVGLQTCFFFSFCTLLILHQVLTAVFLIRVGRVLLRTQKTRETINQNVLLFSAVCKTGCHPQHGKCDQPGDCEWVHDHSLSCLTRDSLFYFLQSLRKYVFFLLLHLKLISYCIIAACSFFLLRK